MATDILTLLREIQGAGGSQGLGIVDERLAAARKLRDSHRGNSYMPKGRTGQVADIGGFVRDMVGRPKAEREVNDLERLQAEMVRDQTTRARGGLDRSIDQITGSTDQIDAFEGMPAQTLAGAPTTERLEARALRGALAGADPMHAQEALTKYGVAKAGGLQQARMEEERNRELAQYRTDTLSQQAAAQEEARAARAEQAALDRQSREDIARIAADARTGNGTPALRPGQRMSADGSRVENIPGTPDYIRNAGLHAKDSRTLDSLKLETENATSKISTILDPKYSNGFTKNFGGWNAYGTRMTPGDDVSFVRNELDSLKSDLKKAGLAMMRSGGSIGQMTVQEWPIVEQALAAINPQLGEAEAVTKLKEVAAHLQRIRDNALALYDEQWGQTQFHNPERSVVPPAAPVGGGPIQITSEEEYNALPSGTTYIAPNGKTKIKQGQR